MGLYEHYQRYKLDPTPDRQTTFSVGDSYVFRGLSGSPLRSPGAIVKVIEIIDTDETGDLQLKLTWLNPDGAPFGRESFYAEVSFVRARELVAQGIWHHIGSADEEVTV